MVACGLALSLGGLTVARQAPPANAQYTVAPAAGANKGEVKATVTWDNCTQIAKVQMTLYETTKVGGKDVQSAVSETSKFTAKAKDTWANTFTGIKSGIVITSAKVEVFDANDKSIVSSTLSQLGVMVP